MNHPIAQMCTQANFGPPVASLLRRNPLILTRAIIFPDKNFLIGTLNGKVVNLNSIKQSPFFLWKINYSQILYLYFEQSQ